MTKGIFWLSHMPQCFKMTSIPVTCQHKQTTMSGLPGIVPCCKHSWATWVSSWDSFYPSSLLCWIRRKNKSSSTCQVSENQMCFFDGKLLLKIIIKCGKPWRWVSHFTKGYSHLSLISIDSPNQNKNKQSTIPKKPRLTKLLPWEPGQKSYSHALQDEQI